MAALILLRYRQRRLLRRNRIFRDRTNPLHKFNDLELFWQFRFRRADILQMTNGLKEELEHLNRKGALPPVFTGRRTALNLPTMNINSSSNGLSRTAPVPHFLFVCFFFFFLLFFEEKKRTQLRPGSSSSQPKRLGFELKAMQVPGHALSIWPVATGQPVAFSPFAVPVFFSFSFLSGVQLAAAAANLPELPSIFPFAHVGQKAVGQTLQQQNQLCSYTVGERDYFSFAY